MEGMPTQGSSKFLVWCDTDLRLSAMLLLFKCRRPHFLLLTICLSLLTLPFFTFLLRQLCSLLTPATWAVWESSWIIISQHFWTLFGTVPPDANVFWRVSCFSSNGDVRHQNSIRWRMFMLWHAGWAMAASGVRAHFTSLWILQSVHSY